MVDGEVSDQNLLLIFKPETPIKLHQEFFLGISEFCLPRPPIHTYTQIFLLNALSKYIDLRVCHCCHTTELKPLVLLV